MSQVATKSKSVNQCVEPYSETCLQFIKNKRSLFKMC